MGHGAVSTAFAGNWPFFLVLLTGKATFCVLLGASYKGMAAAAQRVGVTAEGERRMNSLTTSCGFEEVVAGLLAGAWWERKI